MSLFVLLNHHIMQTCPLEVKRWHVHPTIYSKSRPDAMCRSYYDCSTKMLQLAAMSHLNVTVKLHIYINNQTNTCTLSHTAGRLWKCLHMHHVWVLVFADAHRQTPLWLDWQWDISHNAEYAEPKKHPQTREKSNHIARASKVNMKCRSQHILKSDIFSSNRIFNVKYLRVGFDYVQQVFVTIIEPGRWRGGVKN